MEGIHYIVVAVLLFWAGFVCSISFMEAWLKFRAPGVTLDIGLSIGRKIFNALNRMEWAFQAVYAFTVFPLLKFSFDKMTTLSLLVLCILLIQTFVLLPFMNQRVERILKGETLGRSALHLYFGSLEVLKVGLLIWLSVHWYLSGFPG